MFEIIATELLIMSTVIWFIPAAIEESHEPWLSLWWDWAEQHIDNDFPEVWDEYYWLDNHPAGWYNREFRTWLEKQGIDTAQYDNNAALWRLEKYLLKHKFIKRQFYWNQWVYQINAKNLF